MLELRAEPGWVGAFTRDEAPGALANGTAVVKVKGESGDGHPPDTQGVVLGSLSHPELGVGYFVEWHPTPRHAVFVSAWKLAPMPREGRPQLSE